MNETRAPAAMASRLAPVPALAPRGRLFRKYVALFMGVVCTALVAAGSLEIWFAYQEQREAVDRFQQALASTAADRIGQSIKEIEAQIGWTIQLPWVAETLAQRRLDAQRLLRLVPAITELAQFDSSGLEQLHVSLYAVDLIGSRKDLSRDSAFTGAVANKVYYGPVYFRHDSEPFMSLSVAGPRRDLGVSIAEVDLKFIWEPLSTTKVGETGHIYVVDAQGRLIAHPDRSLVLANRDLSGLPQVQSALRGGGGAALIGHDLRGEDVIATYAVIPGLGWYVFADLPLKEALAPVYASMKRTGVLLLLGLIVASLAGMFLARRMIVPIKALQAGASRIGAGDLAHRIDVATGDELQALADAFNGMAGRLEESHAGLERTVERRTLELGQALKAEAAAKAQVADYAKRLEGKIQVTEDKYRLFIDRAQDGIFTLDPEGRIVEANRETEVLLGQSRAALVGQRLDSFVAPASRPDLLAGLDKVETDGSFRMENMQLERNGQSIRADMSASRVVVDNMPLWLFIARDVTERSRMEQQLRQAQKMDAVGQLSGGVAHDFNNLLTIILGNLQLLDQSLNGDAKARKRVETSIAASKRGATLTKRLLAFARRQVLDPKIVSMNEVLLGLEDMLQRTLGEDIAVKLALSSDLRAVRVDSGELEHALVNLAANARDAMPDGGQLTIETANATLDDAYARQHAEVKPGPYAMVAVSDSGTGIPPEILERVFEPFFTTKEQGKGTGLGLAMVYGFVKQSGGHARVYSEVGHGTSVKLYFPQITVDGAADAGETAAGTGVSRGNETILVVEDEADVREIAVTALENFGYRILTAENGPKGLEVLAAHPETQLLFTDVVMQGGMTGGELARLARERRPTLKILFCSGYAQESLARSGKLEAGAELITKPYDLTALGHKVREVLDA